MRKMKWTKDKIVSYYVENIQWVEKVKIAKDHKKWYDIVQKKYKKVFPKNTVKEFIKDLESTVISKKEIKIVSFIKNLFFKNQES